ncbi:MAG: dTDP-4-keto-6-deoxy-D-glucose epimerase [Deltaproteobacteria bacterium]|nr:MAG: dTDP-4-keto-6-deoxy-D-glucose epimerase [Deltaproteobacteria bacterium]
MIIHPLSLNGAALVDAEPFEDHRGLFARFFCTRELARLLGDRQIVNINLSRNRQAGTIRGMHFQHHPHQEMKLVRCLRGAVFDVLVDLRPESPSFLRWHGEVLSAANLKMLCLPEGFAHGFQTLEPDSEMLYLHTAFYAPEAQGGLRYDDPAVGIEWPLPVSEISQRDASHPYLKVSRGGSTGFSTYAEQNSIATYSICQKVLPFIPSPPRGGEG